MPIERPFSESDWLVTPEPVRRYVESLEQRVAQLEETVAQMAKRIEQLESQMHETRSQGTTPQPSVGPSTLELNAKIEALHNRVIAQTDVTSRLTDLEEQVSTVNGRIAEVADLAQRPAAPAGTPMMAPPPMPSGPDADTTARIEAISARLAEVDSLTQQFAELSQQVSATSSLAGEVEALRQQVANAPTVDAAGQPTGPDPDTLARLDELSARLADIDTLNTRVADIDALRARMADVDALAQQVSQLQSAPVADTSAADAVDPAITDELRQQIGMLAERVAATDTEAGPSVRAALAGLDAVRRFHTESLAAARWPRSCVPAAAALPAACKPSSQRTVAKTAAPARSSGTPQRPAGSRASTASLRTGSSSQMCRLRAVLT